MTDYGTNPCGEISAWAEDYLKFIKPRLDQERLNARTVNQRTVVMGKELYIILEPDAKSNDWMLMENMAGRRIWAQVVNSTLWLAEDSTLKVSELVIT